MPIIYICMPSSPYKPVAPIGSMLAFLVLNYVCTLGLNLLPSEAVYTLKSEKQDEDGGNMQVLMRESSYGCYCSGAGRRRPKICR